MKKNRLLLTAVGAAFIITMAVFIGNPLAIGKAEKCAIVTIQSHEGILPETSHIKKGDCVAWTSLTRGEDVKIIFKEGKSIYVEFGGTSSIVFPQAGTFNYEVKFSQDFGTGFRIGTQTFGTIIVE